MARSKQSESIQPKEHKDWYDRNAGKMRGKPKMVQTETKKASGSRKHSLRKEK